MCIALVCPAGVRPKKAVLRQCFENNPDGAGYAYGDGKSVVIRKGFYTWRSFWEDFRQHAPKNAASVVHFRIATSGKINGENCHPFRIDKKHALIHNGNLAGKLGLQCENVSDTALFVANVLQPTIKQSSLLWRTSAFKYLMEESVGVANKCVIINSTGDYVIFNEKNGVWHEGVWYSNRSFTAEKVHRPTASYGTEKFNGGIAVCKSTFSTGKDIIHTEPSTFFWTKREQDGKVSAKRSAFYTEMKKTQLNSVNTSNINSVSAKVVPFPNTGNFPGKIWSKII